MVPCRGMAEVGVGDDGGRTGLVRRSMRKLRGGGGGLLGLPALALPAATVLLARRIVARRRAHRVERRLLLECGLLRRQLRALALRQRGRLLRWRGGRGVSGRHGRRRSGLPLGRGLEAGRDVHRGVDDLIVASDGRRARSTHVGNGQDLAAQFLLHPIKIMARR